MTILEIEEKYLKENKYTKMIPSYLRDYEKFIRLMKLFSNYVQESCDTIETILSKLNINTATGDILEKIAQRLDITIDKPVDANGNVNQELYEQQLKIAILGNGLKRNSKATRNSLMQLTNIFTTIARCELTDFSNYKNYSNPMVVQLDIMGNAEVWSQSMLEKYVLPNITGIGLVVNYLLYNNIYFGFDRDDVINIIGTINYATASVTQELLYAKATELGYTDLNTNLIKGCTITDAENNGWVYIDSLTGWQNLGAVENGQSMINVATGYGIQGWDKGKWSTTTIV